MASDGFNLHVDGLAELQRNLAAFGTERIVGKIIKAALQSAARVVRPKGASNARALGLGAQGVHRRDRAHGGTYKTYGRIPRAMKVGRAYKPRGAPDLYRVNVVARGQLGRGIFKDKAPHAHLIEYGFQFNRWKKGGPRIAGRPFLGPALDATAAQVTAKVADVMRARIDALKFPT
jgi:hypothetical protein